MKFYILLVFALALGNIAAQTSTTEISSSAETSKAPTEATSAASSASTEASSAASSHAPTSAASSHAPTEATSTASSHAPTEATSAASSHAPTSAASSHAPTEATSAASSHAPTEASSAASSHAPTSAASSHAPTSVASSHAPTSAASSHAPTSAASSHAPTSAASSHAPTSAASSHAPTGSSSEAPTHAGSTVTAASPFTAGSTFTAASPFTPGSTFTAASPFTEASSEHPSNPTSAIITAPTPEPQPKQQNFSCESNGTTKFRLTGTFTLAIKYITNTNATETKYISVPETEDHQANCTEAEALKFSFFKGWSIEYIFGDTLKLNQLLAAEPGNYYISNISVVYIHDERLPNSKTPNATGQAKYSGDKYLENSAGVYYSCAKSVDLPLSDGVTLTTTDFKYKAFNEHGDIDLTSDSVNACPGPSDESSSIVPIAVGASLAGLVVIVLIAYLIGRKRSRSAGYENV